MSADITLLKRSAAGRWPEILSRIGGIDQELLDGRHHPCPRCGGVDRFSMVDQEAGAVLCRKCFSANNGDGLAAIMWLLGCEFPEAIERLAEYLGIGNTNGHSRTTDIVAEVAQRKRMPLESFKAFGAHEAMRGKLTVARVPMYDEFGNECSYFDMATISPEWEKGQSAKDKPAGLFLTRTPTPGDAVLLTEGVKDAAALHGLGYVAVGLPSRELLVKFARLFAGCSVTIVPDRDVPGEEGARTTASRLSGAAATVRIATLPTELKEKGGDGVREILAKRNGQTLLKQAIADAQPWVPGTATTGRKVVTMVQACHGYIEALTSGKLLTIPSGFSSLDASIGGVAAAEMIVIGARPSHGKTMFALQWLDAAAAAGTPGLIISEEMSAMGLGKRSLHSISEIEERDWQDYADAMRQDVNGHFDSRKEVYIAESCGTVEMAAQVIEEQVTMNRVGIVAVDYAQMLKGSGSSRYEQITNVSLLMKQCAVKFDIILLLLCQLSRDIEKRNDRTPRMSDLRDSGQFEQDADVILFLQWPLKDDPKYKPFDEYRIHVSKNRNRPTRSQTVVTKFNPSRQRIEAEAPALKKWDFGPDF